MSKVIITKINYTIHTILIGIIVYMLITKNFNR